MKNKMVMHGLLALVWAFASFGLGSFSKAEDPREIPPTSAKKGKTETEKPVVLTPHQLRHPKAMGAIERQTRRLDPFGIAMTRDLALKQQARIQLESEKEELQPEDEGVVLPNSENLLQGALKKISVSGIMPAKKIIMIGARSVGVGEILAIKHEGVLFRLRLDNITSRRLDLTDLETEEKIKFPLHILPKSFTRFSKAKGSHPKPPSGASPLASTILIE